MQTLQHRYSLDLQSFRKRCAKSERRTIKRVQSDKSDLIDQLKAPEDMTVVSKKRKHKSKQPTGKKSVRQALVKHQKAAEQLTDLRMWIESSLEKEKLMTIGSDKSQAKKKMS